MKALAYADLQATEGHEILFNDPSVLLQRWRVETFYEQLFEIFTECECDCLWDLGDTTDDRNSIPVATINAVIEGINRFPKHAGNVKLIGNHEQSFRNTTVHTGILFESKFNVISGRKRFKLNNTTVIAVSFPESDHELAVWLREELSHRSAQEKIILLGHFQVSGCMLNSGKALDGVPLSILKPASLGLLGHVHRGQALYPHVHYIGSPFQQNFGESHENKRVAIVDTETLTVEWVEMSGFPSYQTITLAQLQQMDSASEDRFHICIRSPQEAEQFYAHPLASRAAEVVYQYEVPRENVATGPVAMDPRSILARYVAAHPPADQDIIVNSDDMVNFGLEIAGVK